MRLWTEPRDIDGLRRELRSSLAVVGEDARVQEHGLARTREAADRILVRIADEIGDGEPEGEGTR